MTGTLYIARHGNTFAPGEPPRRIGARTDLALVPSGRAQAAALGRHFADRGISFARIVAGPLLRTQETATIIAAALRDAPIVETAAWLIEIDHGPDENLAETDVVARIGTEALARWDDGAVPPPGWIVSPDHRIAAWRAALAECGRASGAALFLTSNGAARFAPRAIGRFEEVRLGTGAYGVIAREGAEWVIPEWNARPPISYGGVD